MRTARQTIELFHLLFLRALTAKADDKRLVALKGGCNLRFYFGSVRYSEDMDFDVSVISQGTLANRIDRLLQSPALTSPLRAKGIAIIDSSKPKQTETTQRWKIGLHAESNQIDLRTKIEFSRRDDLEGVAFEATAREIMRPYGEPAILATHYGTAAAIAQKVHALAKRTAPQARDVFDLNLLLARTDAQAVKLDSSQRAFVPQAMDNALALSFDEYNSQVVAYLEPSQAEAFDDADAWNSMVESVVDRLGALRAGGARERQ